MHKTCIMTDTKLLTSLLTYLLYKDKTSTGCNKTREFIAMFTTYSEYDSKQLLAFGIKARRAD